MLSYQRAMGQYETPQTTAEYMVQKILSHFKDSSSSPLILDPCTGEGVFVHELLKQGHPPDRLHAFDIDLNIKNPHPEIHFENTDFLMKEKEIKYDAIIGNPPYKSKRQSSYFQSNKHWLGEQFEEIGLPNLYALFVYHGLKTLKDGGVLTMIVQDSFLTNAYYRAFRRFLVKQIEIQEIILAPRRLFHMGNANVRTAILTIVKRKPNEKNSVKPMRLVDRLAEEEYASPPSERIQFLPQQVYEDLPNRNFAINVPQEILTHFHKEYTMLDSVVQGGTGISTGNDGHYLIKPDERTEDRNVWIPFYKNGGNKDAWYYSPKFYIHKDWPVYAEHSHTFVLRNKSFFYKEGITCSSMGINFSAAYLPKGSLFGVNANLFPNNREDLYYILGLLNSNLIKYMLRKVLNRTNMITSGYIKKLPYIEPSPAMKTAVTNCAKQLVEGKKADKNFPVHVLQNQMNQLVFNIYQISPDNQHHINRFCDHIFELL
ncbi:N-6 DNA methylase [Halobacillus rhizosphaerae]|uniref:Eco57I restriction-modification methylase domain-containing protein n=1 Tax=Halobacillus rhizosphaerae TaxID=3064889 RepID=UPI00398B549C